MKNARTMNRRLMFTDPPVGTDPDNPGTSGGGAPSGTDTTPPAKTFTQEQVNLFTSREAEKARTSVLSTLGFESIEQAEAAIQAQRDAERAKMDEADRKAADAAQKEAAAVERERKAVAREQRAARREALADAGVSRTDMNDAIALLAADGLADDADDDAIVAAVDTLKARRAEMFGAAAPGGAAPRTVPSTTPPGFPPSGTPARGPEQSRGQAEALRRYGSRARVPQKQS